MYIKYFTNPMFEREDFAAVLREKMNVRAKAVEGGVILDHEAFKAVRASHMPHWVFINRQYINDPLHTRPATPAEVESLRYSARYIMQEYRSEEDTKTTIDADSDFSYLRRQALAYKKHYAETVCYVPKLYIVDTTTGEVVYEL